MSASENTNFSWKKIAVFGLAIGVPVGVYVVWKRVYHTPPTFTGQEGNQDEKNKETKSAEFSTNEANKPDIILSAEAESHIIEKRTDATPVVNEDAEENEYVISLKLPNTADNDVSEEEVLRHSADTGELPAEVEGEFFLTLDLSASTADYSDETTLQLTGKDLHTEPVEVTYPELKNQSTKKDCVGEHERQPNDKGFGTIEEAMSYYDQTEETGGGATLQLKHEFECKPNDEAISSILSSFANISTNSNEENKFNKLSMEPNNEESLPSFSSFVQVSEMLEEEKTSPPLMSCGKKSGEPDEKEFLSSLKNFDEGSIPPEVEESKSKPSIEPDEGETSLGSYDKMSDLVSMEFSDPGERTNESMDERVHLVQRSDAGSSEEVDIKATEVTSDLGSEKVSWQQADLISFEESIETVQEPDDDGIGVNKSLMEVESDDSKSDLDVHKPELTTSKNKIDLGMTKPKLCGANLQQENVLKLEENERYKEEFPVKDVVSDSEAREGSSAVDLLSKPRDADVRIDYEPVTKSTENLASGQMNSEAVHEGETQKIEEHSDSSDFERIEDDGTALQADVTPVDRREQSPRVAGGIEHVTSPPVVDDENDIVVIKDDNKDRAEGAVASESSSQEVTSALPSEVTSPLYLSHPYTRQLVPLGCSLKTVLHTETPPPQGRRGLARPSEGGATYARHYIMEVKPKGLAHTAALRTGQELCYLSKLPTCGLSHDMLIVMVGGVNVTDSNPLLLTIRTGYRDEFGIQHEQCDTAVIHFSVTPTGFCVKTMQTEPYRGRKMTDKFWNDTRSFTEENCWIQHLKSQLYVKGSGRQLTLEALKTPQPLSLHVRDAVRGRHLPPIPSCSTFWKEPQVMVACPAGDTERGKRVRQFLSCVGGNNVALLPLEDSEKNISPLNDKDPRLFYHISRGSHCFFMSVVYTDHFLAVSEDLHTLRLSFIPDHRELAKQADIKFTMKYPPTTH